MHNDEPVLTSTGIIAAVSAVVAMLVAFGVIDFTGEQQELMIAALVAILGVLAPIIGGIWARGKVTPLVAPKDTDGKPLVRPNGLPALEVQRMMAQEE